MTRGNLRVPVARVCAHCRVDFITTQAQQKYCTGRCKNAAGGRLRKQRNLAMPERRCYKCKAVKPSEAFSSASKTYCRECDCVEARRWAAANPEKRAAYKRTAIVRAAAADPDYYRKLTLRKFGLTLEAYDDLLLRQEARCAICRTAEPGGRHGTWHVDHDHTCCPHGKSCGGCIRGLLCQNCNIGLGHFLDDPARLMAAVQYLSTTAPGARLDGRAPGPSTPSRESA